ncbi:amino acid adenylation domain-containing protein [Kitasatospora acidiphila]|uniref:Amino acid adenylation domain-containing protein n=1 Tax=Kitasatospora acidiphila TaxID=2567942 RepID=A0A540WGJ3_9ACTN|nr:amino acid adenylation domain-containing protein [Kitasatospora acidiphila]
MCGRGWWLRGWWLRGLGGGCGGVAVGRGVDLVVALLGVWRAGAAFVPLDVEYPVERLRLMVGDCGPGVVLGDAGGLSWLEGSGVRVLSVGEVEGWGLLLVVGCVWRWVRRSWRM